MRISVMTTLRPGPQSRDRPLGRIVDYARRIEKRGFPGIWVTNSLGRGRPTLDPLVALAALSAATERVELGTAVLQVSLRHPIELAHRVQSVQALSGGRLRLGVGSGSTQADFDLLGADYDQRFRTLMSSLEIMRRAWRGEPVNGGTLSPWPGCEGGPPVLLGAWRNPRWITYAAKQCQGWTARAFTAAGRISNAACGSIARPAAATRSSPMSSSISPSGPKPADLAERAKVSLVCPPDEARQRLKRIEQIGFDEVLARLPRRRPRRDRTGARLSLSRVSAQRTSWVWVTSATSRPSLCRDPGLPDHGPPAAVNRGRLADHLRSRPAPARQSWSCSRSSSVARALGQVERSCRWRRACRQRP